MVFAVPYKEPSGVMDITPKFLNGMMSKMEQKLLKFPNQFQTNNGKETIRDLTMVTIIMEILLEKRMPEI